MNHSHRIRAAIRLAVSGVVTAALCAAWSVAPVRACSTPVFRYAMYNWAPAPYYVFYFHHGQVPKEDEAVNKLLHDLAQADPPANVVFAAVDTSKQEELKRLPKVVGRAYQSRAEGQQPLYLVYSPWVLMSAWMSQQYAAARDEEDKEAETTQKDSPADAEKTATGAENTAEPSDEENEKQQEDQGHPAFSPLFAGRLDGKKVEAMLDSPVRKQLGNLLEEGNAAVLLILTGADEDASQQAEKESAKVLAMAAGGEFPVSGGDDFPPGQFMPRAAGDTAVKDTAAKDGQEDDTRQEDSSNNLKLAVLKLSRTDPAEEWLVDSLLSVEPDLRDDKFAKSPMVFTVYGRGRAMPPYVGKGITAENLAECVMFLCGPCSCMIKDQNPGSDLLVRRNWDAVAEALAADDPEFSGGPFGYQEFETNESGDFVQASAADASPDQTTPPPGDQESDVEDPRVAQKTDLQAEPIESQATQTTISQSDAESSAGESPAEDRNPADGRAPSGGTTDSFALRWTWSIGIWVALAAAVVLAAGFVLILRQRPS